MPCMVSQGEKYAKQMLFAVTLQNLIGMTRVDFSFAIGNAQYRVERLPETDGSKKTWYRDA